ncbi:hypothetical protein PVOR_03820 [Paenibacillus vortex V453]|uniref:Uncharacterized protein n=1 Tax=Paenibacillus vortex V453 TaxID=715225 RepID=A0A2R9T1J0_9BACL|nr:hypothetical protein PVOR_03820 [Paenibacillus vortex V453]
MKIISRLFSEYLLIPRPFRLLILWGWIFLFFAIGIKLNWFFNF